MIKVSQLKNNKNIVYNVLGAFGIKGGGLLLGLFTMPAYINYFQEQKTLGIWFTLLSILTWVLNFDLGIGNGLRNTLVKYIAKGNKAEIKKCTSSAYFLIGILSIIIAIAGYVAFAFVNWNSFLNISDSVISNEALNTSVTILFLSLILQFFLKLITSILYAIQKSALVNLNQFLVNLLVFIFVFTQSYGNIETRLINLSIAYLFAVNFPLILISIYVFTKDLKGAFPSFKSIDLKLGKQILSLGSIFLLVQIMYMIITTTDNFLITKLTTPENVVDYRIYNSLFLLVSTLYKLALTPIWSAVTKAFSEKNYNWIKKLYHLLLKLSLIAIVGEFVLIIFLQDIIDFWLQENTIKVNYTYALTFAITGSFFVLNAAFSSIANGLGRLKVQAYCFTIGAVLKIALSIVLIKYFGFSWNAVLISTIIIFSIYSIAQAWDFRYNLDKMSD